MTALPDRQFFKIGEAAEIVGVKAHVLRYWESEFPSIKPLKTRGAHRMYRRSDVELLCVIHKLLHHEGYTIAGARKRIRQIRAELSLARAQLERVAEMERSTAGPRAAENVLAAWREVGQVQEAREVGPTREVGPMQESLRELAAAQQEREVGLAQESRERAPAHEVGLVQQSPELAAAPQERALGSAQEFRELMPAPQAREVEVRQDARDVALRQDAREVGLAQETLRELALVNDGARVRGLVQEASRELGLRAELIQVRRELSDLLCELDVVVAGKRAPPVQASATVTSVVPKTVLLPQRKLLR